MSLAAGQPSERLSKGQVSDDVECHHSEALGHIEAAVILETTLAHNIYELINALGDERLLFGKRLRREGMRKVATHVRVGIHTAFNAHRVDSSG